MKRSVFGMAWLAIAGIVVVCNISPSEDTARPSSAFAVPPSGGCPTDTWCGLIQDPNGGCKATICCPEGETYCEATSRSPFPFPRAKAATPGTCLKVSTGEIPYCLSTECGGAILCSESSCTAQGEGVVLKSHPIIDAGGAEGCSGGAM